MTSRALKMLLLLAIPAWLVAVGLVASGSVAYAMGWTDSLQPMALVDQVATNARGFVTRRLGAPGTIVSHPAAALDVTTARPAQALAQEPGILVAAVELDSPAAQAGIVRGDILLQVDGQEVNTPHDLTQALNTHKGGDTVSVLVRHGDEERTLSLTFDANQEAPFMGIVPCAVGHEMVRIAIAAPGGMVAEVVEGSPAAQAGLQAGDMIEAVDGTKVSPDQSLSDLIAAHQPGDTITLTISRPGSEAREVSVTLGEHPDRPGTAYLGVQYHSMPIIDHLQEGGPFRLPFPPLGGRALELPGDGSIQKGLVIHELVADGPAATAGLQQGDIITAIDGAEVSGPESLQTLMADHAPGDTITLTVTRPGQTDALTLTATLAEHPRNAGSAYLGAEVGFFMRVERRDGAVPGMPIDPEALPEDFQFEFEVSPDAHGDVDVFQFQLPAPEGMRPDQPFVLPLPEGGLPEHLNPDHFKHIAPTGESV